MPDFLSIFSENKTLSRRANLKGREVRFLSKFEFFEMPLSLDVAQDTPDLASGPETIKNNKKGSLCVTKAGHLS